MGCVSAGKRFGRLVVEELEGKTKNYQKLWLCKCDCGSKTVVRNDQLTGGGTQSCGCLQKERLKEAQKYIKHKGTPLKLKGEVFGRLTALEISGQDKNRCNLWKCKCKCGNLVDVRASNLRSGHARSCGCLQKETASKGIKKINRTHGKSHTNLYKKWAGIKRRCHNKDDNKYKDYGGRGIGICNEWENDFLKFYNWAISNEYRKGLTIDRIDVNGNYEPDNCRWVTMEEQASNKRTNVFIEHNGESKTVAEWSRITGLNAKTLYTKISRGLEIDLEQEIKQKMEKNKARGYKHGKHF